VKDQFLSVRGHRERLTATQAARDFSRLLDRIEAGGEAVVERHSALVAVISQPTNTPRRISECMSVIAAGPSARPDARFGSDLKNIVRGNPTGKSPHWE
jgi:antitoxin (DNA-binding transcriptional repressor) of toxin-antitoxin stability system